MIYEKRPDTVEAVQYIMVDGVGMFSPVPKWMDQLINACGKIPFIMFERNQAVLFDTGTRNGKSVDHYHIETINPLDWVVRDENGRIDIYDEDTFIRKFKKVT